MIRLCFKAFIYELAVYLRCAGSRYRNYVVIRMNLHSTWYQFSDHRAQKSILNKFTNTLSMPINYFLNYIFIGVVQASMIIIVKRLK